MHNNTIQTLKTLSRLSSRPDSPSQPAVQSDDGIVVDRWYKSSRHGRVSSIYVVEVKKETIYYKDKIEDKHIQNMSRTRFLKFYRSTGGRVGVDL